MSQLEQQKLNQLTENLKLVAKKLTGSEKPSQDKIDRLQDLSTELKLQLIISGKSNDEAANIVNTAFFEAGLNVEAEKKLIIDNIRSLVKQLKDFQDKLSEEEFSTNERVNKLASNLQLAINAYKSEAKKRGLDPEEASDQIKKILDSSGLKYKRDQGKKRGKEEGGFGSQLEGKKIKDLETNWLNITGDVITRDPNAPEIVKVVHDQLSIPEEQLVFRMMSEDELQNIMDKGYIGGSSDKQIEADTTWWGNGLKDSLNQRRGKIRITDTGQNWGGDTGVMIAVKRKAIQDAISEERELHNGEIDAYKTKGKIPIDAIVDIFHVGLGRKSGLQVVKKLKI